MPILGSNIAADVGLRLILNPIGSNIVIRTACCSVGTILPVYSTFKAIERKDQNEQQKWLIYWTAYGSFSLVEVFSDKLLTWFPYYYHFKFAFLVWLQLPTVEGANQLYKNHLRPFFLRYQDSSDQVLGYVYREMMKLISAHQAEIELLKTLTAEVVCSVDQFWRGDVNRVRPQNPRAIQDQPRTDGTTGSDSNSDPDPGEVD
ncbi:HVA22-like protein k [Dionaea muscipula]